MHVESSVLDHVLAHRSLPESWVLDVAAGDGEPPTGSVLPAEDLMPRMADLRAELLTMVEPFRPADQAVWDALFPDWSDLGGTLVLSAGWPAPYDAGVRTMPDGRQAIVIDVARLAEYPTDTAEQVTRQILDHEVAHLAIARTWQLPDDADYAARLDHVVFDEGIGHYLGMRGHPAVSPSSERFEQRRAVALAELRAAREIGDPAEQHAALDRAGADDDFWAKFGAVAGMFACALAERDGGMDGLRDLVAPGWRGFTDRVLAG